MRKLNQIIIEGTIKELTENGFVIDCNNELFSVISLYPFVMTKRFKQGDEIRVVGHLAIGSNGIEIKADFIDMHISKRDVITRKATTINIMVQGE